MGSTGEVYALDNDTRFLEGSQAANFFVMNEDFTSEETALPKNHFDIIHARNIVMHLPNKKAVIKKMASLLKPGGVLIVEDMGIFDGDYQLADLKAPKAAREKEANDYLSLEKNNKMSFHSGLP